jgi:hypothetical protein
MLLGHGFTQDSCVQSPRPAKGDKPAPGSTAKQAGDPSTAVLGFGRPAHQHAAPAKGQPPPLLHHRAQQPVFATPSARLVQERPAPSQQSWQPTVRTVHGRDSLDGPDGATPSADETLMDLWMANASDAACPPDAATAASAAARVQTDCPGAGRGPTAGVAWAVPSCAPAAAAELCASNSGPPVWCKGDVQQASASAPEGSSASPGRAAGLEEEQMEEQRHIMNLISMQNRQCPRKVRREGGGDKPAAKKQASIMALLKR